MALFQPTNIIPSSFTNGVVDAENDVAEVSWQVNGSSAMTNYQIDFYTYDPENAAASEYITCTNLKRVLDGGFLGTDRFGQPKMFTWSADGQKKWSAYNSAFTNGKQFKFKITQWYEGQDSLVTCDAGYMAFSKSAMYYFEDGNDVIVFTVSRDVERWSYEIRYSYVSGYIWLERLDGIVSMTWCNGYRTSADNLPSGAQKIQGTVQKKTDVALPVYPREYYLFQARSTPQVLIYLTDSAFQAKEDDAMLEDGATLTTSIGYFRASYIQTQGVPVRSVRWQIATATVSENQWRVGEIIADTNSVDTPTLQFMFNGFFNEQNYAIRCLVVSDIGQQAENPVSSNDGWIFFSIDTDELGEYHGNFTLECLRKENAALLTWTSNEIPPEATGEYSLNDGEVSLEPASTIKWERESGFGAPWTVAIEVTLVTHETFMEYRAMGSPAYTKIYYGKGLINSVSAFSPLGDAETSIDPGKKTCRVKFPPASVGYTYAVTLYETPFQPTGELARISMGGEDDIVISGNFSESREYDISVNGTKIPLNEITSGKITLILTSTNAIVYAGGKKFTTAEISYTQKQIENIQISGGGTGTTFRCVTVYQGSISDEVLDSLYSDESFKPSWYADDYKLHMSANFDGNIDGGETSKIQIYRQEVGKQRLDPVFYGASGNILQLKDYGIVSRKTYTYWLYEYDKNDAFLIGAQCTLPGSNEPATISTCFQSYSLLVCNYDDENGAYHVRKQYLFALNLSEGSVGNNNSPAMNANFTPYPTRMPSTQNYASGTLQGLIGVIYTVPALVEQVGGIKHASRPSTLDYFDNVDLEKELRDLSVTTYTLFLRDMKGRIRMIATSGAVTTSTNLQQRQQPITISFPWVEIGDASDVSIIQTPKDEEWGGSEELGVGFDVDLASGTAAVSYPKPYNGTKFLLVGAENAKKRG